MPPAYEVLLLNTAVPQIQAAQSGDTYVVPRDIAFSAALTLSAGTANGVPYLNGSKVLTTGSALTFDGTNLLQATGGAAAVFRVGSAISSGRAATINLGNNAGFARATIALDAGTELMTIGAEGNFPVMFQINGSEQMRLTSTGLIAQQGAVFNESGADSDFRVESDNNTHMLFVDAGNDRIGIGTNTPSYEMDFGAGTTVSRRIRLQRGSDDTSQNMLIGWNGIDVTRSSVVLSSPQTTFSINQVGSDGTRNTFIVNSDGGITINEDGYDADFRVESDTNTHALFVEGSSGNVGIGTSSPYTDSRLVVANGNQGLEISINNAVADTVRLFAYDRTGNTLQDLQLRGNNLTFYSGSSERLRITSAGNVSIGGTADRATTVGTAALNIFNGTAPVGTLANGISIYSSSGEAYVMDAAGNATLFSPHDAVTNEWIFKSKHTPTGKVLKIDVERLLKFVNDHFGLDAVHEFIED